MNMTNYVEYQRFPSRLEAIDILEGLLNSDVIDADARKNLQDVQRCIEQEIYELDVWGAAYENVAPLLDSEVKSRFASDRVLAGKYRLIPRPNALLYRNGCIFEAIEECETKHVCLGGTT